MARKKSKPPSTPVVNISLSEIDLVAKGTELANRMKQIASLKKQAAEEASRYRGLIDEQIELADTIASQILGGTEARNQATLRANQAGELEVPEKPFEDKTPTVDEVVATVDASENPTAEQVAEHFGLKTITPEDAERIEAEKVAEGLRVPRSVADAIARSGGEVDLSAAKAKNGKAKGKKQPPAAPKSGTVIVATAPSSCPECGGKVAMVDDSGIYGCQDQHECGCRWTAVVESVEATKALGPLSMGATT